MFEPTQSPRRGVPFGTLWGILSVILYGWAFVGVGVLFIWKTSFPASVSGWAVLLFSSAIYLFAGIGGFGLVALVGLYLTLRDPAVTDTLKKFWPLILAAVYMIVPNIPGPIDEAIVGLIAAGIEGMILLRARKVPSLPEPRD